MVGSTPAQEPGEQTTVWQLICTIELSSCDSFRCFLNLTAQLFISWLTFTNVFTTCFRKWEHTKKVI